VSNSLNRRWDLISHNIHAASFLLDPIYIGKTVDDADYRDGENYLKEKFGDAWKDIYPQFLMFRGKTGLFERHIDSYDSEPILFWNRFISIKDFYTCRGGLMYSRFSSVLCGHRKNL